MPTPREAITAEGAPDAVGPYSHAVRTGDLLFCSGQVALDPATGELAGDGPAEQAERCLRNLEAVCGAAGTSLDRAIRCTVLLTDMGAFADVNAVYEQFVGSPPPARVTVAVSGLPKDAQVEIDAVLALP